MSLRKLHKETVCAKETIVLSFPMEKLKEHLTCTGFIFLLPFFYEAQAKQNHTEVYQFCDSVKNDAHLKEDLSMYLCYKGEFPCQLNRVGITHLISVFCSEAGESALHTELAGEVEDGPHSHRDLRLVLWSQHFRAAGSAVRAHAPVSCSVVLLQSSFNHTWSLFAYAKAYSALKTTPPFHTP